jgi:hypothetical protein
MPKAKLKTSDKEIKVIFFEDNMVDRYNNNINSAFL